MGKKFVFKVPKHGAGGKKKRENTITVTCNICGEVFPRAYLAKAHEKACAKMNTAGDPKPYKCPVCGKGFPKKDAMTKHATQHPDRGPAKKSPLSMQGKHSDGK